MEDRKSPKTDLVVAAWQNPCKVTFKASKSKKPRTAVLQMNYKGKWTDYADAEFVRSTGAGRFVLNDDPYYWYDYCDYRKFNYRIVVSGPGTATEVIDNGGLMFLFSDDYYDCQPGDTDWMREYYELGAAPAPGCHEVLCKAKGTPVFSHESRKWNGTQNAAGQYKCRWYKFYRYKDGSQAPYELVSEWWSSSKSCS
jgi:hypothetical protein